jgi:antirestriction protein ArdC
LVDLKAEDGRTVAANRKGHATIGAPAASSWLFPCGQPGRHISTGQLTQRLNRLGIRPNQARNTAFFQLAAEIPAAILARTLGLHTDVAVTW